MDIGASLLRERGVRLPFRKPNSFVRSVPRILGYEIFIAAIPLLCLSGFLLSLFVYILESYLGSLFATLAYIVINFFGSFGSIPSGRHSTPLDFPAVWLGSFSCSFSNTVFGIPDHTS